MHEELGPLSAIHGVRQGASAMTTPATSPRQPGTGSCASSFCSRLWYFGIDRRNGLLTRRATARAHIHRCLRAAIRSFAHCRAVARVTMGERRLELPGTANPFCDGWLVLTYTPAHYRHTRLARRSSAGSTVCGRLGRLYLLRAAPSATSGRRRIGLAVD